MYQPSQSVIALVACQGTSHPLRAESNQLVALEHRGDVGSTFASLQSDEPSACTTMVDAWSQVSWSPQMSPQFLSVVAGSGEQDLHDFPVLATLLETRMGDQVEQMMRMTLSAGGDASHVALLRRLREEAVRLHVLCELPVSLRMAFGAKMVAQAMQSIDGGLPASGEVLDNLAQAFASRGLARPASTSLEVVLRSYGLVSNRDSEA